VQTQVETCNNIESDQLVLGFNQWSYDLEKKTYVPKASEQKETLDIRRENKMKIEDDVK
jgi:hypothetical protein